MQKTPRGAQRKFFFAVFFFCFLTRATDLVEDEGLLVICQLRRERRYLHLHNLAALASIATP